MNSGGTRTGRCEAAQRQQFDPAVACAAPLKSGLFSLVTLRTNEPSSARTPAAPCASGQRKSWRPPAAPSPTSGGGVQNDRNLRALQHTLDPARTRSLSSMPRLDWSCCQTASLAKV
jgi:hypothetical protein